MLHNGKRNIGRDDHGLACQQPLANHIEYLLPAEAGVTLCTQIIQNEKIGTHKRFRVMVAVRAEAALHTVDHVGHSHKEDGLQTVNQSVGNTPDDLRAIIAGTKAHTLKKKRVIDAPAKPSGSLLIDIQAKLQEGKGAGYARWAKNFNLKQLSQTLIYLEENNLLDRIVLEERTTAVTAQYHTLSAKMKSAEQRMAEIKVLQQHIINYAKTRNTYVAYRKAGYSKKFLSEHESEIILHKAAKLFFDEQGLKKLPTVKSLQAEYAQLLSEKKAMYAEYQQARDDMRSLQTAKANVDRILGDNSLTVARESEKDGRLCPFSDLQNRVAAGFFQRFQDTELCSAGIGAEPQQAETPHFHFRGNEGFRIWRAIGIACYSYTQFGIILASNASVIQMRKTIHSASTERMVFLLVEALPQAPMNAVLRAAAARFFESLFDHLFQSTRNA